MENSKLYINIKLVKVTFLILLKDFQTEIMVHIYFTDKLKCPKN